MAKNLLVFVSMLLLLAAVPAYAWTVEYQNTGGTHDLSVAGDWWRLTDGNEPGSRSVSAMPGASDYVYIRTGGTEVLNSSGTTLLGGARFHIGGDTATSGAPSTTTEVQVLAGTIQVCTPNTGNTYENFTVGFRYDGTLTIDGGTVKVLNSTGGGGGTLMVGCKGNSKTGTVNVLSGELQFGRIYGSWAGGTCVFNQSGGLVDYYAGDGSGLTAFWFGPQGGSGSATYNLSGTGFLNMDGCQMKLAYKGGLGVFNMTGGSLLQTTTSTSLYLGANGGTSDARFYLLGGRTTLAGSISQGQAGSKSLFKVNQTGVLDLGGSWTTTNTGDVIQLVVGSASDFQMAVGGNLNWANPYFLITVNPYSPTVGQTWKVVDLTSGAISLPGGGNRYDFYNVETLLGWCLYKDTVNNDLRLEYVPEPATLTLLGLGGLALIRRRRS